MAANPNDIFAASLPEPHRILGQTLKPFCLGHYFILSRYDCAFVAAQETTATREDLIFAVLVCSMSYEEFTEWIEPRPVKWRHRMWLLWRCLTFRMKPRLALGLARGYQSNFDCYAWGVNIGFFNFTDKCKAFMAYLEEHTKEPKYWIERDDTGSSGAHWAHSLLDLLVGPMGYTHTQAMNMPLHEALLHSFRYGEMQGTIRLFTPEELEQEEKAVANGT